MPSNHLILCHLLLLPPILPSIRVFSNESDLRMRWPKYWTFSFSISPSSEYSGLMSFRMDCLDLLAVQRILKSLRQHHSSKASILLQCSAFFISSSHKYEGNGSLEGSSNQPPTPNPGHSSSEWQSQFSEFMCLRQEPVFSAARFPVL